MTENVRSVRRQARFCPEKSIPPDGIQPEIWYEVCQGRRRDDHRPGMVLLDLGDRRMLVPEACIELREAPAEAARHPLPLPRRRPEISAAMRVAAALPERRRLVAVAASLLPLGLAAAYATSRIGGR